MKVYVKATNVADIQAKIAKKQADIDKKYDWITKKEASIQKRLAKLSKILDPNELARIRQHVDYIKEHDNWQLPSEYDTADIDRKYWGHDTAREALYGIDRDAEAIYTSRKSIEEMLYRELRRKADAILYPGDTRNAAERDAILRDLYPNMSERAIWDIRKKFNMDYIETPFLREFGVSKDYASRLWGMTDAQIHDDNVKSAKKIILDLLKRVTKITGPVVDWSNLNVTAGNGGFAVLNGIVIGEDGKARVESIYAEGPVQRLHVRTLVKPIK